MRKLLAFAAILLTFACLNLRADEDKQLNSMTLEDLLGLKVTTGTRTEVAARQSPGIVMVITDDEIHNSGARDLIDVLQMVPGISFGNDVLGAVGIGIRGNWGHEGKVLLIWDGVEMNEINYGCTFFGNHYPVNQIKRIEIIRGPGSVIYGGSAELAVINVTTKSGAELEGMEVHELYGRSQKQDGVNDQSLALGKKLGPWDMSFSAFTGKGQRSDSAYQGYSFKGNAALDPMMLNLGLKSDHLTLRVIKDHYHTTNSTLYGDPTTALLPPANVDYDTLGIHADYRIDFSHSFKLTPYVKYNRMQPWEITDRRALTTVEMARLPAERLRGGVLANYDHGDHSILVGVERGEDQTKAADYVGFDGTTTTFADGTKRLHYDTRSVYAQDLMHIGDYLLTVGARYDRHSAAGDAIVPRVGFTRSTATWHWKALAALAYKDPYNMNLNANPDLKPEKTQTYELEGGHAIGSKSYLTANLFLIKMTDAIVFHTQNGVDNFFNSSNTGTEGVEADYRYIDSWGSVLAGYSYSRIATNHVDVYSVPGNDEKMLGMPNYKATLSGTFKVTPSFKINPSVVHMSSRFSATNSYGEMPAVTLANLYLLYDDLGLQGLSLGAGVFNIFNNDYRYIQPYGGATLHDPMPSTSREIVTHVNYHLNF